MFNQKWNDCAHGLILAGKNKSNIYICDHEEVVSNNQRPPKKYGGIVYVELTSSEENLSGICDACKYHKKRADIRNPHHKLDETLNSSQ